MLDANAVASASWVSASIATPRGAPVEPEVSFTTATSPIDRGIEAGSIADTAIVVDRRRPSLIALENTGRAEHVARRAAGPRAERRDRAGGRRGRRVGWRGIRPGTPDRWAPPDRSGSRLRAARRPAARRRARASASISPKVARRTGETTATSLARRSTSRLNASTMQSLRTSPRALPPCEFDTAPIVSTVDHRRDDASSLGL